MFRHFVKGEASSSGNPPPANDGPGVPVELRATGSFKWDCSPGKATQLSFRLNVYHPTKRAFLHRSDSLVLRCQTAEKKSRNGYWQGFDDLRRALAFVEGIGAPASVLEVQARGKGNWIEAACQLSNRTWPLLSRGPVWGSREELRGRSVRHAATAHLLYKKDLRLPRRLPRTAFAVQRGVGPGVGGADPAHRRLSPDNAALEAGPVPPQRAAHAGAVGAGREPRTPSSACRVASTVRRSPATLGDRRGYQAVSPTSRRRTRSR